MKKLVLALTAIAAFSGSALAADLPARTYSKAPVYEPIPSWTGFYIFGGGGGGLWDANTGVVTTGTGTCILCTNQKQGGDGWFGTVGAGYDWQFNGDWVAGIFADGQFGSIKGSIQDQAHMPLVGKRTRIAMRSVSGWAIWSPRRFIPMSTADIADRIGPATTLLTTQTGLASWHSHQFVSAQNGWFVGGGVENNLALFSFLGPIGS